MYLSCTQAISILLGYFFIAGTTPAWGGNSAENAFLQTLLDRLESNQPMESAKALETFTKLEVSSPALPIVAQALSLIFIDEGNYSQAWKILSQAEKGLSSASQTTQVGHGRIKLYLSLQAGKQDLCDEQFRTVVKLALPKDLRTSDRQALGTIIGWTLALNEANREQPLLKPETVDRIGPILEQSGNRALISSIEQARTQAGESVDDFSRAIDDLKDKTSEEVERMKQDAETVWNEAKMRYDETSQQLREGKKSEKELKSIRSNLFRRKSFLENEWKKPTPGRPVQPREPREPRRPNVQLGDRNYETEMRDYERERRAYQSELSDFQRQVADYPQRLSDWQQRDQIRRADLQANQQQLQPSLIQNEQQLQQCKMELDAIFMEEQEQKKRSQVAQGTLAVLQLASKHLQDMKRNTRFAIRPSMFPILQYEEEATRLKSAYRSLGNGEQQSNE